MKQKAYAAAGVDIDLGNRVKATLPQLLAGTHRREVLGKVGGFGGLMLLYLAHLIPFAAFPWSLGIVAGIQIATVMALLAEHIYWGRTKQGTPAS